MMMNSAVLALPLHNSRKARQAKQVEIIRWLVRLARGLAHVQLEALLGHLKVVPALDEVIVVAFHAREKRQEFIGARASSLHLFRHCKFSQVDAVYPRLHSARAPVQC